MTTSGYLEQLQQDKQDLVDNLTQQGIQGLTGDETFTELVPEVLNISGGGSQEVELKDVNFFDYDGTPLYSYSKNDFLQLENMPENPTHEELTAQGWNWSLADAKTYITNNTYLDIGQNYKTSDDKLHIYIDVVNTEVSYYISVGISGSATIEWGDETSETITGTGTITSSGHKYSTKGSYIIRIYSQNNITIPSDSNYGYSRLCWANITTTPSTETRNLFILSTIKKIELSNNCIISNTYCFAKLYNLETITLPSSIATEIPNGAFYECYDLKYIVIPSGATGIGSRTFQSCLSLKSLSLSKSIGYLNTYAFYYCYGLERIIISSNITTGLNNKEVFNYCYSLNYVKLSNTITRLAQVLFANCYSLNEIELNNSLTNIGQSCFANCYSLSRIKVPNTITTIEANTFNNCYGMKHYDFTEFTSIPTLSATSAFNNMPQDCRIVVPNDLVSTWKSASQWSTFSSRIISETEWNNM